MMKKILVCLTLLCGIANAMAPAPAPAPAPATPAGANGTGTAAGTTGAATNANSAQNSSGNAKDKKDGKGKKRRHRRRYKKFTKEELQANQTKAALYGIIFGKTTAKEIKRKFRIRNYGSRSIAISPNDPHFKGQKIRRITVLIDRKGIVKNFITNEPKASKNKGN